MKTGDKGFFWASFTDLMISLFFIMLVLYVLSFVMLKNQQQITEKELLKVKEIQRAVKELPTEYFEYQKEYKRFALKEQILFLKGTDEIPVDKENYLLTVGRSIQSLTANLKSKYKDENIKYMIVIEGMASKDPFSGNDILSYKRALALSKLWERHGITFDPNFCETQIAGSGIGGVGRRSDDEKKNQQFLIQIVPKIGDM